MDIKLELIKVLKKVIKEDISNIIETPNDFSKGDVALPCFFLSKKMRKSPNVIAEELVGKIKVLI